MHLLKVLRSLTILILSQAFLGVAGLISLPFISRGLGLESYGDFSLFIVMQGIVINTEYGRVMMIKKIDHSSSETIRGIAVSNVAFLTFLGLGCGYFLLDEGFAVQMALLGFSQSIASPLYARLCKLGRVVTANIIRNVLWGISYFVIAFISYNWEGSWYGWVFVLANTLVVVVYAILVDAREFIGRIVNLKLVISKCWREASDIVMFNISGAVMVSVDKTLLNHFIPASNFGQYIAQSDLALRMNVISNGLGTYLFPKFIKIESELGKNRLQAQVSKVLLVAYLIMLPIVLTLSVFSREIVAIFFGDSFVTELPIYQIFVLGFYINIMGFILVPYQRATGNYTTSRRIYGFTAIIMLIVGLRLIPEHGIFGALICYLIARCSDFFMLISFIKESNFKTHGGPVFLTISFCIFLYVWVSIG